MWYDIQEGRYPCYPGCIRGPPPDPSPTRARACYGRSPKYLISMLSAKKEAPGTPQEDPPRTPLGALAPPDGGPEHPMLTGGLSKGGYRYYHDVGVRMHHHIITLRI